MSRPCLEAAPAFARILAWLDSSGKSNGRNTATAILSNAPSAATGFIRDAAANRPLTVAVSFLRRMSLLPRLETPRSEARKPLAFSARSSIQHFLLHCVHVRRNGIDPPARICRVVSIGTRHEERSGLPSESIDRNTTSRLVSSVQLRRLLIIFD